MGLIQRFKNHIFCADQIKKDDKELEAENHFINDILPKLEFGDIICALRYDFEWDKKEIGPHTNGPYVVIGKTDNKIIGMYCTGSAYKRDFFEIGKNDQVFSKPTYTSTSRIRAIDYEAFISVNMYGNKSLNDRDKALVANKLSLLPEIEYEDLGVTKKIDINLENYSKLYFGDLVQNKRDHSIRIVLDYSKGNINTISIDNCFDFNCTTLEHPYKYAYVSTLSSEQIDIIKEKYNDYNNQKMKKEEPTSIQRGVLLSKNTNYYYVYNIEKQAAQMFQVKRTDVLKENTIVINHKYYIPYYDNNLEIYIKDKSYSIVGKASEVEAEFISGYRKSYYKSKKKVVQNTTDKKQTKRSHFEVGDIIRSDDIFAMEFIVIGIYNDIIITISLSAYNEGRIIYREFKENDYSLSKCGSIENSELIKQFNYFNSLGEAVIDAKVLRLNKKN